MICKNCGKAIGNEKATCPFCGSFLTADQIDHYVEMKKERDLQLRPQLLSERYGIKPIVYQSKEEKKSFLFWIVFLLAFLLLVLIMIIF